MITPVVVWGSGSAPLRPDPREVAGVYFVPLEDLLDPENLVATPSPRATVPVLALAILGTLIYAPTAAVLHQFAEVAVLGGEHPGGPLRAAGVCVAVNPKALRRPTPPRPSRSGRYRACGRSREVLPT